MTDIMTTLRDALRHRIRELKGELPSCSGEDAKLICESIENCKEMLARANKLVGER
jgi:hypothetical protein